MPDVPDRPHRTGAFWLDLVVALTAVCVSGASLWVALRADQTQERLLAASVWPVLQYETSDYVQSGPVEQTRHVIRFTITNAGVGPARVRWFDVYYLGKAMPDGTAMLFRCCESGVKHGLTRVLVTNYMQGRVLAARETVHFMEIARNAANLKEFAVLDKERLNVYVRSCYCSVLDDCWILDSRQMQPAPTHNCPPADTPLFSGLGKRV